jgi:hypothetical protein
MLSLSVDTQDMVLVVPVTIVPRRGSDDKAPVDCSIWPLASRLRKPLLQRTSCAEFTEYISSSP